MSFKNMLNQTVYTYSYTEGAAPTYIKSWSLAETLTAGVHQLSGMESMKPDGKAVNLDLRLFVESTTSTESKRVKWNNRIFEIIFIDEPMKRGHHYELNCTWLPNEDTTNYGS